MSKLAHYATLKRTKYPGERTQCERTPGGAGGGGRLAFANRGSRAPTGVGEHERARPKGMPKGPRGISRAESERFASRLGIDDDAGNECFRGGGGGEGGDRK